MGFWSKVKGVFGRIGSGIKKGWDWMTTNKDKIVDTLNTASEILPDQYKGQAQDLIRKGSGYIDRGEAIRRQLR